MKWRIVVAVAGVLAVAALVAAFLVVPRFGTDTIDRSQPAVLQSLRDLSQFHAAAGEYQVVLDIERDVQFVPAALAGQRTLFVAAGSVNAYVEFEDLAEGALKVSADGKSVEVDLPKPVLDKPNLHQDRCYVFAQERGLIDRLASIVEAPDQQPFYVAAEQKIADAARESGLAERAAESTRRMLTGMLGGLGYQVRFTDTD
ncbi:DUF4230 domain-containing protein [Actinosynnema sp. NPDC047251]|uniref:Secreted protein n=1 Tax=Saccharothrix espanaensis (strain ATCC 51144 / DSM 44229 / JCM 9112 / NBRC 15066 / NRRL 15764) TaxID=1179773 RepID=K0KAP3_SACES|nr:DUF4230 domain-containing protein [Saccharothrix espanaensis]CCH33683.1 hypothetical protein BN6_64400 [Saccharothrix espanaensis DSM 44229]